MKPTKIEDPCFSIKRWLVGPVLGIVLVVSGGLLFIDNLTHAAGSARISFASNRSGNFDIYIMDINSADLHRIIINPVWRGKDKPPSPPQQIWSPDGRFLAYVSDKDGGPKIYVMDTETREHRRLTDRPGSEWAPAWSPDGKWIAFTTHHHIIYKTDVNGEDVVQLAAPGRDGHPAWSPDGKQIAFLSHKRGERKGLYVMDADGRRLRRVSDREVQAIKGTFGNDCAWSPDGKQIAFCISVPQARRYHLCVIDVDGKNFRQLTRGGPIVVAQAAEKRNLVNEEAFPPPPPHPLPEIYSPAWSPDGKWIAYVYSDTALWRTADIYIIDAEGKGRGKPLVTETGIDVSPAWVPEGFLSVSPSAEKQTTLWGKLKQAAD